MKFYNAVSLKMWYDERPSTSLVRQTPLTKSDLTIYLLICVWFLKYILIVDHTLLAICSSSSKIKAYI